MIIMNERETHGMGKEPRKPVFQRVCKGRDKWKRLNKRRGQGTGEGARTCRSVSVKRSSRGEAE